MLRKLPLFFAFAAGCTSQSSVAQGVPTWPGYGADAQHTGQSQIPSQSMRRIAWQAPVDLDPQYSGVDLLTHYGSPSITNTGVVLMSVKTSVNDSFVFQARRSSNGALVWSENNGYFSPNHDWVPTCSGVITNSSNTFAMPGIGGEIAFRTLADTAIGQVKIVHFYGEGNYNGSDANGNPAAPEYDSAVKICSPITADAKGDIFFSYRVEGPTPLGLTGGFARISASGVATYVSAASVVTDPNVTQPAMNCGPVLSSTGAYLYVVAITPAGNGYLVKLSSTTLQPINNVALVDPLSGGSATILDDSSASPSIGPDGNVYYGVMSNPFWANNDRGFLLQFTANLTPAGAPSSFGWDDCGSIVPASIVPSYTGGSKYLLLTKYNNYADTGGNGLNRVAIVDPNATMIDPVTGLTVMKVVQSVLGVTPDSDFPNVPGAVREWCINSAAIDVPGRCAIINSEDGSAYRWDFASNSLTQSMKLTAGVGEAYTPTMIGHDGTIYAINNATLFAIKD